MALSRGESRPSNESFEHRCHLSRLSATTGTLQPEKYSVFLIQSHPEGSLVANNCRRTRKKRTKRRSCTVRLFNSFVGQHPATSADRCRPGEIGRYTPDDVLLEIFDFCGEAPFSKKEIEAWQILVHVHRRWRSAVFRSPHRLDLQLVCTAKTPARDTLDVWPALPIFIRCHGES